MRCCQTKSIIQKFHFDLIGLANFVVSLQPSTVVIDGSVEQMMGVTLALKAALTGSLPSESSVVTNYSLESNGCNQCSIGDLQSKTLGMS